MTAPRSLIVTLTGPSGAGKTHLSYMMKEVGFEPLISTTTRTQRNEETDGIHYHFLSVEDFNTLLKNNGLIEHVEYGGNEYGISAAEAERAFGMGKPAVLVAEPNGVEQIHNYCKQRGWEVFHVFVNNPVPVLIQRLMERFTRDNEGLDPSNVADSLKMAENIKIYNKRIVAVSEFEQDNWVKPAYDGRFHYDMIVDTFDENNSNKILESVLEMVQVAPTIKVRGRRP